MLIGPPVTDSSAHLPADVHKSVVTRYHFRLWYILTKQVDKQDRPVIILLFCQQATAGNKYQILWSNKGYNVCFQRSTHSIPVSTAFPSFILKL